MGGNPPILIILPFCNSSLKPPSESTTYESLKIITLLQSQTSCLHQSWWYVCGDLHSLWMIFGYQRIFESTRWLLIHILRRKVPNIWIIQQQWRPAQLLTLRAWEREHLSQGIETEADGDSKKGRERLPSTIINQAHTTF